MKRKAHELWPRVGSHLHKGVNLLGIGLQELSLSLGKGALRGDVIGADAQRGEGGQHRARQRPHTLAHGLQHVQKAIVARRREDCWTQLQL